MDGKYVQVPKELLDNKAVSLKAKGLYALILAQPLYWENSILALVEASGSSKYIITLALQELERAGYLERHQLVDENGQFCGMEYEIKERGF